MDRTVCLLAGALVTMSAAVTVSAEPPAVEPVLRRWAAASATIPPPGKSARQRTLFAHRRQFSGHEVSLVLNFLGPVDVADLLQRYRFGSTDRNGNRIRLRATPKDDVERLFFEQFELTLDANTYLPIEVAFTDRKRNRKPITLFTDQQRERIARNNGPVEAPVPVVINLSSTEPRQRDLVGGDPWLQTAPNQAVGNQATLSPHIRNILAKWSRSASQAKFSRFSYDHVFNIENRTTGTFSYETPNKGRLEIRPREIREGDRSQINGAYEQSALVSLVNTRMPSLTGLHWKQAKTTLEKLGYAVRIRRGTAARRPEQVYHVYEQSPKPDKLLTPRTTVVLTLFDKVEESSAPEN